MKKNLGKATNIMAYAGTIMVWLPILFTLITAIVGSIAARQLRIDYLMPAELFLLVLAGALLLWWASIRAGEYKKAIGGSLVLLICSLFASQGIAVVTGLASGETEAAGWPLLIVNFFLILYIAAVLAECVLGILLLRKMRKS